MRRTPLKRKSPMSRGRKPLRAKKPINPVNRKRKASRFEANYGSKARVIAINTMPCLCGGNHPACEGLTQNAHRVSKAHRGDWRHVLNMSAGCHRWQGDHGFDAWEDAAGLPRGAAAARAAVLAEVLPP